MQFTVNPDKSMTFQWLLTHAYRGVGLQIPLIYSRITGYQSNVIECVRMRTNVSALKKAANFTILPLKSNHNSNDSGHYQSVKKTISSRAVKFNPWIML